MKHYARFFAYARKCWDYLARWVLFSSLHRQKNRISGRLTPGPVSFHWDTSFGATLSPLFHIALIVSIYFQPDLLEGEVRLGKSLTLKVKTQGSHFGHGAGPGAWAVWVELCVTRRNPGVFRGKRVARWQSPFREIPNDLPREPGDVSPAFSPPFPSMAEPGRPSEAEKAGEQATGQEVPTERLNKLQSLHVMAYYAAINHCNVFRE